MKRILFVALAATLLAAGCQKTEIINSVRGDAMTFTTAMSKLTKSAGTADADEKADMQNLKAQNFKVWAYYTYADAINGVAAGAVYDGMEALDVTYAEASQWTTGQDYYWPGEGKSLDFFAVSTSNDWAIAEVKDKDGNVTTPAVAGVSVDIEGKGLAIGGRKLIVNGYGVDASDPNDDLMVAEFVRQHQGMNGKNVSVHFKHALAKVQFRFTTNAGNDKIEVKSLKVAGLNTKGTLTATEVADSYVETNGRVSVTLAWSDHASAAEFTDDYEGNLELQADVTDAEGKVTKNDKEFATWLVLPQVITDKTVTIEYDITSATGNTRSFKHTFALTRAEETDAEGKVIAGKEAFNEWKINQVVIYTINLSPNKITFVPSVQPWEDAKNLTDQN